MTLISDANIYMNFYPKNAFRKFFLHLLKAFDIMQQPNNIKDFQSLDKAKKLLYYINKVTKTFCLYISSSIVSDIL